MSILASSPLDPMLLRKYIHALLSSLQSEPFLSPTTIGKKLPIHMIFKNKFAINVSATVAIF